MKVTINCLKIFVNMIFCLWQQMTRHLEEPIKIQIESDFKTAGFIPDAFSSFCCLSAIKVQFLK